MLHNEHITLIILIALLASTPLATITTPNVCAQQEVTPTHTFETQEEYVKLAISADGKHITAISNTTDKLSTFNRTHMLWSSPLPGIHSLAMSQNASLITAAATSGLYLFNIQNATPQFRYDLKYANPIIALSDDGSTLALAAPSADQYSNITTTLHLLETENQNATWHTTLQGTLESLSISGNGNYISATTSHPALLYLLTKQQPTPLWTYSFGERSGAAKLSNDGNYIVTSGGNQTGEHNLRVYRFHRQSPMPNYIKVISELPSMTGISVSSQGSIFTLSFTESNRLILFNLDLPPYGYGPGSVLNTSIPCQPTSISMSSEGKHTAIGTNTGIYIYEYINNQLDLTKQRTTNHPFITNIAITANGEHLAATATKQQQDTEHSAIYIFDLQEPPDIISDFWARTIILATIALVSLTTVIYTLRRKQKPQKPSRTDLVAPATKTGSGELHA